MPSPWSGPLKTVSSHANRCAAFSTRAVFFCFQENGLPNAFHRTPDGLFAILITISARVCPKRSQYEAGVSFKFAARSLNWRLTRKAPNWLTAGNCLVL